MRRDYLMARKLSDCYWRVFVLSLMERRGLQQARYTIQSLRWRGNKMLRNESKLCPKWTIVYVAGLSCRKTSNAFFVPCNFRYQIYTLHHYSTFTQYTPQIFMARRLRARQTKYQFVPDLFRERARVRVATGGETRNVNLIYATLSHGVKSR